MVLPGISLTCPKLAMEILEQYVKSVQFVDVVLVSLVLILSKFTYLSDVSIVDFEQVNTGWKYILTGSINI